MQLKKLWTPSFYFNIFYSKVVNKVVPTSFKISLSLVQFSWQSFISSIFMKLDFICQLSLNSTIHVTCNKGQLTFNNYCFHAYDPNKWCIKIVPLTGHWTKNPQSRQGVLNLLGLAYPQIKIYLLCVPPNHNITPFAYPQIKTHGMANNDKFVYLKLNHTSKHNSSILIETAIKYCLLIKLYELCWMFIHLTRFVLDRFFCDKFQNKTCSLKEK